MYEDVTKHEAMKTKLLILIISILALSSCAADNNEAATIRWIESAEKPIICKRYSVGELGAKYTLFSADGKLYFANKVYLALPDTIKQYDSTTTKP